MLVSREVVVLTPSASNRNSWTSAIRKSGTWIWIKSDHDGNGKRWRFTIWVAFTVPIAPFTNPKIWINITLAFWARWITGSSPPASSELPFVALWPEWRALITATGWPFKKVVLCYCFNCWVKAVCSLLSDSPWRSLNSPLVGNCKRERRVHPWTLKAAMPVGEVTFTLFANSCFRHAIRKDLPVPAVPVIIILSGFILLCKW